MKDIDLPLPDFVDGLLSSGWHLHGTSRHLSSYVLLRAAISHSSSVSQLESCLTLAGKMDEEAAVDLCVQRFEALFSSAIGNSPTTEHQDFKKYARKIRSDIKTKYVDMATPYQDLITFRGFGNTRRLLYADIDLNTVDGSAIWMASMARILSRTQKVIIVSKQPIRRDAVVGDLLKHPNVLFITPGNTALKTDILSVTDCAALIRGLDHLLPELSAIFVRGLTATQTLMADRQLYKRVYAYLTDIYEHTPAGIQPKPEAANAVDVIARQSAALLVQTPQIEALLREFTDVPFRSIPLPPPVPDNFFKATRAVTEDRTIRIGYAGKIAPQWGIRQLASWVETLRSEGLDIEVTLVGDKVSGAGTAEQNKKFRHETAVLLERIQARQLGAMERQDVLKEMRRMDFVWCWRPADFENHTLELSSKLVENVIAGLPCIAFPSPVNTGVLEEDYPFYAKDLDDFRAILSRTAPAIDPELRQTLYDRHAISGQSAHFDHVLEHPAPSPRRNIILAAHDPKFCHAYFSGLKTQGHRVSYDDWEWGEPKNEQRSRRLLETADTVFCEWGLANAAWHSQNIRPGQNLIVRVHAQEVRDRARKFGPQIRYENVNHFVFVTEWVRQKAIKLFGWPEEKTVVIPNFLLDQEYLFRPKAPSSAIHLGMVGMIPMSKRLDRALDLILDLHAKGHEAHLHLKGPQPHELPFMLHPSRASEMERFAHEFGRIEQDPVLQGKVHFYGWGNDVAVFYQKIDHILSPSDTESFHYALADGVLTGCHPVIWERDDAGQLFSPSWVIQDTAAAAHEIIRFRAQDTTARQRELEANRALLVDRYGSDRIFSKLDALLLNRDGQ
ncbi:glycosyltransferase [Pseudophaeobacter sp. 1A16562]|uniref:glycosyltransferase n=1 Tax=unclassified Pseudophaeobacter TaxID=2637024 RepID=UPI0034D6A318